MSIRYLRKRPRPLPANARWVIRRGAPGAGWLVEDCPGDAEAAARAVALQMGGSYLTPGSRTVYDFTVASEEAEADVTVHLGCEVSVQVETIAVRLVLPGVRP